MRIESWLETALAHDPQLYIHSGTVGLLTGDFASFLGFSISDREALIEAALLHDIGKLWVSRELLQKPAALTLLERAAVQCHPHLGGATLRQADVWSLQTIEVAEKHHERLDGTGYPLGLTGSAIGECVRIVTICDVYAAMTEERPYTEPMSWDAALAVLERKRTRLDMRLVQEFARMTEAKMRSQRAFAASTPHEFSYLKLD